MEPNDDSTTLNGTQDGDGSDDSSTQSQSASPTEDPIALARKRQAGAEAARQKAEEALKEARAKLEQYESATRSQSDKDLSDNAKLQERLAAAETRAAEAEAKAEARILDVKYPNARKQLPEVTDEVRLAYFEALLADDPSAKEKTPPPPQNPNASNRAASGDATAKPKEKSSQDMLAELKAGAKPEWL